MTQTVPYCEPCRESRKREIAMITSNKGKGKAKVNNWSAVFGDEDDEEEDEWGGGEPGIIKVSFSLTL
jgi:hypothetical protein